MKNPEHSEHDLPGNDLLVSTESSPHFSLAAHGEAPAESRPVNPFVTVHRLLRGRYRIVVIAATVMAITCGAAGFFATKPEFHSIGMIQIAANKPSVLYQDRDDSRLRLFDAYVSAEVSYINSRPVLERAVPRLVATINPATDQLFSIRLIRQAIEVKRKEALILLTAKHHNNKLAAAIVNALIDSYEECRDEAARREDLARERQLSEREHELISKLDEISSQLIEVGQEYGLRSIATAHVRKIAQIAAIDERISELAMTIAAREATDGADDVNTGDAEIKRLIVLDHATADMLFERTKRAAELAVLQSKHASEHYKITETKEILRVIDIAIEDRRKQLTTLGSTGALTKTGESGDVESLKGLQALKQRLEMRWNALRSEAKLLNSRLISLGFLEEERMQVRTLLDNTRNALDAVRVESHNALPGTAVVKARGSVPENPASDKRKAYAVVGAGAGVAGCFGAFVVSGLLFHRYRLSDELDVLKSEIDLVGVLPAISDRSPDLDEQFTRAVHRMRSKLELQDCHQADTRVIAISAVDAGDGSSTVAMALARSFADTQMQTLLIDADLVDASITDRLDLLEQSGLRESILGNETTESTVTSLNSSLTIMPVGMNTEIADHNLSNESFSRVLKYGRTNYDVVILDVGPFDDRIAAGLGTANSDQAVLVTSSAVKADRLKTIVNEICRTAPRRAGLAFNFASTRDPMFTRVSQELKNNPIQKNGL